MNQEEIKKLAIECGATENMECVVFAPHELRKYTAAVEARERERCANLMDDLYARGKLQHIGSKYIGGMIRELK